MNANKSFMKIIKNKFDENGNLISKSFIKEGNEKVIRDYFNYLFIKAQKYAKINLLYNLPEVKRSKNEIYFYNLSGNKIQFLIKK